MGTKESVTDRKSLLFTLIFATCKILVFKCFVYM